MPRCEHISRRAGEERQCVRAQGHQGLHQVRGLTAHTPLPAVSGKRSRENRQRTEVLRPIREAQLWCARCGKTGVGLDAHELLSRARGGSILDEDNIVLLCRACHDDVTFRHHLIPDAGQWVKAGEAP